MAPVDDEPLEEGAAARIDAAVAAIEQPVADLFDYSHKTRRLVWAFAGSLAFDVGMSVAVALFAIQVHRVAARADALVHVIADLSRERSLAACRSRNDFKRLDLARWEEVLRISTEGAPEKDRQAAQAKRFRAFILSVDKPEDCAAALVDPEAVLKGRRR